MGYSDMESTGSGGKVVLNDTLLQFLLENCLEFPYGWIRFARRHVRRASLLQVLAQVACASKRTNLNACSTLQFAALHLTSYDVAALDADPFRSKPNWVLHAFEINMSVFRKSWRLDKPVPQRLRMVTLSDLGIAELHQLRGVLLSGWQVEIEVHKGDGQADLPNVWVTPTCRLGQIRKPFLISIFF